MGIVVKGSTHNTIDADNSTVGVDLEKTLYSLHVELESHFSFR